MTQKDYKRIASVLCIYNKAMNNINYKVTGSALVVEITERIADELKQDNPRFDYQRFYEACSIE